MCFVVAFEWPKDICMQTVIYTDDVILMRFTLCRSADTISFTV